MPRVASWLLIFMIGCLVIVIGIEGSLGKMVAVAFVPADLVVTS